MTSIKTLLKALLVYREGYCSLRDLKNPTRVVECN